MESKLNEAQDCGVVPQFNVMRRRLLFTLAGVCVSRHVFAQANPDIVQVYLVPLNDFPQDLASAMARDLQRNMKLWVKASLALPPLPIPILPGSNQFDIDAALTMATVASNQLPETSSQTQRIFLTTQDLNERTGNFRFQFSMHNKQSRCSIVSLARVLEYSEQGGKLTPLAMGRFFKLVIRAIGEVTLGWHRSIAPNDVMYSPLMGVEDLDKMRFEHVE